MAEAYIPKTGIAAWRREFYDEAFLADALHDPDLTWSNWIRKACDRSAMRANKVRRMPVPAGDEY